MYIRTMYFLSIKLLLYIPIIYFVMCDPLSENPTSLHFFKPPFVCSLLSRVNNQWVVKISALSDESSSNGQKEKLTNRFAQRLLRR